MSDLPQTNQVRILRGESQALVFLVLVFLLFLFVFLKIFSVDSNVHPVLRTILE